MVCSRQAVDSQCYDSVPQNQELPLSKYDVMGWRAVAIPYSVIEIVPLSTLQQALSDSCAQPVAPAGQFVAVSGGGSRPTLPGPAALGDHGPFEAP